MLLWLIELDEESVLVEVELALPLVALVDEEIHAFVYSQLGEGLILLQYLKLFLVKHWIPLHDNRILNAKLLCDQLTQIAHLHIPLNFNLDRPQTFLR